MLLVPQTVSTEGLFLGTHDSYSVAFMSDAVGPPPPWSRPVAVTAHGNLGNFWSLSCASATPVEDPTTGSATVNTPVYMPHRAGLSLVANIAQISMPAVLFPNISDSISTC